MNENLREATELPEKSETAAEADEPKTRNIRFKVSAYDPRGIEQWLSERAAEGKLLLRGDEFVIGFYGKDLAEAEKKFGELVTRMDRRFAFGEAEVDLSISVGVVIVEEEVSYDDLFKTADQALYSVKEKGKNNYRMVSYKSIYKQK